MDPEYSLNPPPCMFNEDNPLVPTPLEVLYPRTHPCHVHDSSMFHLVSDPLTDISSSNVDGPSSRPVSPYYPATLPPVDLNNAHPINGEVSLAFNPDPMEDFLPFEGTRVEGFSPIRNPSTIPVHCPVYCIESPNGTRHSIPIPTEECKPVIGSTFNTWEEVLSMYRSYAEGCGFSVRIGQTKKVNGVEFHKYLRCNRYGKPQTKRNFDTMCESSMYVRQSTFKVCDCKAHIRVKVDQLTSKFILASFVETHNHELVPTYNRDLLSSARKLSFSTKQFIHHMSLNGVGPIVIHRLRVSMRGGHHNVNGTAVDYKNFRQSMRLYIGERDSHLVPDRLADRFQNLPDFFFEFTAERGELRSVFWADEISKLNYQAFSDVLAFDATYQTNKYNMIFVPFTGVDHNKNCVTFGAGLLHSETIESYKWLLESFLKAHEKQPKLVLTDQDPSMRQAISQVFVDSRHRLCMWHIMKKLPAKFPGDLLKNTDFRSRLHRFIYIKPTTFESRWTELLETFELEDHDRLGEMYGIRERWVPAYFREIPMCCLMKTTSRCESSNSLFKVNSNAANTLVQFMMNYDTRIDSQRYRQRLADFKTSSSSFVDSTALPIEKHAFEVYTNQIYNDVRKEIMKGKLFCYISNSVVGDSETVYYVSHLDKRYEVTNTFQVTFNPEDQVVSCSCRNFIRIGYLCRHAFCVFRVNKIEQIPTRYLEPRWMRDVLPKRIFSIENRYGVDKSPESVLRNKILELINDCVDVLRFDTESLTLFAEKVNELKASVVEKASNQESVPDPNLTDIEALV